MKGEEESGVKTKDTIYRYEPETRWPLLGEDISCTLRKRENKAAKMQEYYSLDGSQKKEGDYRQKANALHQDDDYDHDIQPNISFRNYIHTSRPDIGTEGNTSRWEFAAEKYEAIIDYILDRIFPRLYQNMERLLFIIVGSTIWSSSLEHILHHYSFPYDETYIYSLPIAGFASPLRISSMNLHRILHILPIFILTFTLLTIDFFIKYQIESKTPSMKKGEEKGSKDTTSKNKFASKQIIFCDTSDCIDEKDSFLD